MELNLDLNNENLTTETMISDSLKDLPTIDFEEKEGTKVESETINSDSITETINHEETEGEKIEGNAPQFETTDEPLNDNSAENIFNYYNLFASEVLGKSMTLATQRLEYFLKENEINTSKVSKCLETSAVINNEIVVNSMLNEAEKEKLKQPLERVLQEINLKIDNPYISLLITVGAVGIGKYFLIKELQQIQNESIQNVISEIKNLKKDKIEISNDVLPKRNGFFKTIKSFFSNIFSKKQ